MMMSRLLRLQRSRWGLGFILANFAFATCHAEPPFQVGVGTHIGNGNYPLAPTLAAIDTLDVSARDDVRWASIETSPGKLEYNSSHANFDALIADVLKRNKRPVIVLPGGNKFYDGGGQITSSAGIAAFARYAQFVASRVAGSPKQIEVWNEWSHGTPTPQEPKKGDPVAYANLLRGTYQALKSQNPNNVVIGGAVTADDSAWVEKFAAAGGLKYLDAFSVHPYVHCKAPKAPQPPSHLNISGFLGTHSNGDTVRVALAQGVLKPVGGSPEQAVAALDSLKKILDRYSPDRDIPVYVTEMGWPTSAGQCGIDDSVAAAYLQRFMLLAAARSYITGVWWYDLFDDGADPGNREFRFGLAAQNHMPKPAYHALLALKDILNSNKRPAEAVGQNGEIVVSGQQADGRAFYAAWLPTNNFSDAQPWSQGLKLSSAGFRPLGAAAAGTATSISAVPTVLVQQ
jgi:hypothetical protein